MIALKPARLNFVEAASVPVVAVTAWQALFEKGSLKAGGTALIHGGAGSVGAFGVQMAHRQGATVIATESGADVPYVEQTHPLILAIRS